jgi:hypothetical protein
MAQSLVATPTGRGTSPLTADADRQKVCSGSSLGLLGGRGKPERRRSARTPDGAEVGEFEELRRFLERRWGEEKVSYEWIETTGGQRYLNFHAQPNIWSLSSELTLLILPTADGLAWEAYDPHYHRARVLARGLTAPQAAAECLAYFRRYREGLLGVPKAAKRGR